MVTAFGVGSVLLGLVWKQIQRRLGIMEARLDELDLKVSAGGGLATHDDVNRLADRFGDILKDELKTADRKRDETRRDMHDRDVSIWNAVRSIDARCSRIEGLLSRRGDGE